MQRREFLQSAALAAAIQMKADAAPAKGESRNQQSGVSYRRLGRTGYLISEVVMGGNTISPTNYDHVLLAVDQGLNYLDTAPAYGPQNASEKGYAMVIKARGRDKFFINTKVSAFDMNRNKLYADIFASLDETEQKRLKALALEEVARRQADSPDYFNNYFDGQRLELDQATLANAMAPKYGPKIDRRKAYHDLIIDSVEGSLTRLGTDHVDLLMCPHGANTPYEVLNHHEIFEAFEKLKKAGKVRFLGVSSHTDPAGVIEAAIKTKVYSAAMIAFNFMNAPWTEKAVAAAHKADFGVIAMKAARPAAMGRGRVTPPERLAKLDQLVPGDLKAPMKAYAWALRHPGLTACISEMSTVDHVKDNMKLTAPKKSV